MLCTASSHFVLDLCRRPFYGCARRLLFVHKETPGTRLQSAHLMILSIHLVKGDISRFFIFHCKFLLNVGFYVFIKNPDHVPQCSVIK